VHNNARTGVLPLRGGNVRLRGDTTTRTGARPPNSRAPSDRIADRMTYCLAIRVQEGLVCLADGRITSGNQVSVARKATLHGPAGAEVVIMTSGLRSLRDKTIAYFDRQARQAHREGFASMLDAVSAYAACLRRTAEEDRAALESSRLTFNLNTIIAGRLAEDETPSAFQVYPEGNWIEINERTPYLSIGATGYGKPILDRTLTYTTPLAMALKSAYLSFDSTRVSSADVGFPVDILTFNEAERQWRYGHFVYDDLREQHEWWNRQLTELAAKLPDQPWRDVLLPSDTATPLRMVREE
jgi:putative proteasome-type protease